MSLSNEIKIVRQKAFLTQTQFAEQLDVSFATVNRWEAGRARPHLAAMKNIKQFCKENKIDFKELEDAWIKSKVIEEE